MNNFIGPKENRTEQESFMTIEDYHNEQLRGKKSNKPKPEVSVNEQLRAMGHFFDLDPKKVNYYIRQLELSGKI